MENAASKSTFSIVVVLYKKTIEQSETLQSLKAINSETKKLIKIILWDNGPEPLPEEIRNSLDDYFNAKTMYMSTPQNISLAKIYNQATAMSGSDDFLIIFDQDSEFDQNFLNEVESSIARNEDINLFVPYIKDGDMIFSPGDFHLIKGKYWKELRIGRIPARNKVMVASGMVIRMSYLRKHYPIFNEDLKLYGIDSDFAWAYAKTNPCFFVFNYNLNHRLSVNENEGIDRKMARFKDMCYAIKVTARRQSLFHYFLASAYTFYLSSKMTIRYNDFRFLK